MQENFGAENLEPAEAYDADLFEYRKSREKKEILNCIFKKITNIGYSMESITINNPDLFKDFDLESVQSDLQTLGLKLNNMKEDVDINKDSKLAHNLGNLEMGLNRIAEGKASEGLKDVFDKKVKEFSGYLNGIVNDEGLFYESLKTSGGYGKQLH